MQDAPAYDDVLLDVFDFLEARVAAAEAAGIPARRGSWSIPGIGFGKTVAAQPRAHPRPALLHGTRLRDPVRRLAQALHRHARRCARAADRVPGSIAVALEALRQGAQVIRVHDVKETRQAVALWTALNGDEE